MDLQKFFTIVVLHILFVGIVIISAPFLLIGNFESHPVAVISIIAASLLTLVFTRKFWLFLFVLGLSTWFMFGMEAYSRALSGANTENTVHPKEAVNQQKEVIPPQEYEDNVSLDLIQEQSVEPKNTEEVPAST